MLPRTFHSVCTGTVLALMLCACQRGASAPLLPHPGDAGGTQFTVRDDTPRTWRCVPGPGCGPGADYQALQLKQGETELFLIFAPALGSAGDEGSLNQHFRSGDLYLPQGTAGVAALHAEADRSGEATVEFLPAAPGRLKAQVRAMRYRLQVEGDPRSPDCRTDDMQGVCRREIPQDRGLNVLVDLPLPRLP